MFALKPILEPVPTNNNPRYSTEVLVFHTNLKLYSSFSLLSHENIIFSEQVKSLLKDFIETYQPNASPFFALLNQLAKRSYPPQQAALLTGGVLKILMTTKSESFNETQEANVFDILHKILYEYDRKPLGDLPALVTSLLASQDLPSSTI